MGGGDNLKSRASKASEQRIKMAVSHVDRCLGEEGSRKTVQSMPMSGTGKQVRCHKRKL